MVYWTRGRFFRCSKYHMTPDQLRDIYSIYRSCWNVAIHVTCFRLEQQVHTNSEYLGDLLSWSYGSWIYNYLCNQSLSPLTLRGWIPVRWGVLDTTLCDKVCQRLAVGLSFSPGIPVSSINKTDNHDIIEILLKVALNTINPNPEYLVK